MRTLEQRFSEKYDAGPASDCWLWNACIGTTGYGLIRDEGVSVGAHRVSWKLNRGLIPEGLCVLHRCDVRPCVNPDHLFLGTRADNTADMMRKGRCRSRGLNGERNGFSKLTENQVLEIRAASGIQLEIAAKYGIHRGHVSDIRARKVWRHI